MQKKLLEGIKVVDFGIALAGPMIGKTLADYGAEVIRVEEGKAKIDGQRLLGSFRDNEPGVNRSIGWNEGNTGKLSLAINLSHPKGADVIKRLIASWADVALDNFAGGAMKRMGIGYEDLKKVKPDIIMLSTCMMGQTGPYAHHRGFGVPLTAMTGYYNLTGWPGVVIRAGTSPEGLPVGVQILARPFAENQALAVAAWLEEKLGSFEAPVLG